MTARIATAADMAAALALLRSACGAQGYGEPTIPRGDGFTTFIVSREGIIVAMSAQVTQAV